MAAGPLANTKAESVKLVREDTEDLSMLLVSAFTTLDPEEALFIVVFTFVLPVIATIGLVGNILSIIVLNNREKFKSVIYIYLRGVAVCDLTYMLLIINMCVVITISDYRQFLDYYMSWNPPGLEDYLWNYLPPLLNAIGSSSSVIVVFLTLNRKDPNHESNSFPL